MSDHDGVVVDLDLCAKKKPKSQHIIYNWKKAKTEEMNIEVTEKLAAINFNTENIEENWTNFKQILIEARDKFIPHKMSTTRHNLPFFLSLNFFYP